MNENTALQIFEYKTGQHVRTVMIDGEPWFVARDVCEILGLGNSREAVARLDEDESMSVEMTHPQSPNKTIWLLAANEPGLYNLIMASRKPEARNFKRWITHEVIPSIRKTSFYGNGYMVMLDLAFLGIYVQADDEQQAKELAMQALFALHVGKEHLGVKGMECGVRESKVTKVEDDDGR